MSVARKPTLDNNNSADLHRDLVPPELKEGCQHVCWSHEQRNGKDTKVPKIAGHTARASSTNPETWRPLNRCLAAFRNNPDLYAGVGRVIAKDDPYVGIDIDDVRDPETGTLTQKAAEILARLSSYSEVSPSKTGVKIWVRATLDRAQKKPGMEIYPHGRYFTLTGWRVPYVLPTVEERSRELEALIEEEFPKSEKTAPRRPFEGDPDARIDIEEFLDAAGVEILREVQDGTAETVFQVVCPWVSEHTDEDESGTRTGQYPDGALFFHCEHSHCAHRKWAEFRQEVAPHQTRVRRGKVYARRSGEVRIG